MFPSGRLRLNQPLENCQSAQLQIEPGGQSGVAGIASARTTEGAKCAEQQDKWRTEATNSLSLSVLLHV